MNEVNTFLNLDIFGYSPRFTVMNRKKFNTIYGFLMSIIICGGIIYSVCHFGSEILYKVTPRVVMTTYNDANPSRINLTDTDFIIALGLQKPFTSFFIDETIYELTATHNVVRKTNDGKTILVRNNLDIIRCSDKNITLLPAYFLEYDLNNLYCLKNASDLFIEGDFAKANSTHLDFSFAPCKNSTENSYHCKSSENIREYLDRGYMSVFLSDITIEPTNYIHPGSVYGKHIYQSFSMWFFREFSLHLKKIQVISETGWLMEEKNLKNYFSFDFEKETWDYRDTTESFFKFKIQCSLNRLVYERSYIKIQEIAANLGGIIKFLLICGEILIFYFRKIKYKEFLFNCFFDLNSLNNPENKNFNFISNDASKVISNWQSNPGALKNGNYINIINNSKNKFMKNNCYNNNNISYNSNNPNVLLQYGNDGFNFNKNRNFKMINNEADELQDQILQLNLACKAPELKNKFVFLNKNIYNNKLNSHHEYDSTHKRLNYATYQKNDIFGDVNNKEQIKNLFKNNQNNHFGNDNDKSKNFSLRKGKKYSDYSAAGFSNSLMLNNNLTFTEGIRTICCLKNQRIKKRLKIINLAYDSFQIIFDWMNYLKSQNEYELIKRLLFSPEQNDLISITMKHHIKNEINVIEYKTNVIILILFIFIIFLFSLC